METGGYGLCYRPKDGGTGGDAATGDDGGDAASSGDATVE
jgi:hypothetical protein